MFLFSLGWHVLAGCCLWRWYTDTLRLSSRGGGCIQLHRHGAFVCGENIHSSLGSSFEIHSALLLITASRPCNGDQVTFPYLCGQKPELTPVPNCNWHIIHCPFPTSHSLTKACRDFIPPLCLLAADSDERPTLRLSPLSYVLWGRGEYMCTCAHAYTHIFLPR